MAAAAGAQQGYRATYIDIGANLLDDMFAGRYHGKQVHEGDVDGVLSRAAAAGVADIVLTAGSLADARAAVAFCRSYRGIASTADAATTVPRLHCTVGVHPTQSRDVAATGSREVYIEALRAVLVDGRADGTVVAVGEVGLDGDRTHFADMETQRGELGWQFDLALDSGLPLFLHDRASDGELLRALSAHAGSGPQALRGVVHSFTGSMAELQATLDGGWFIGINGCSLKTAENCAVAAAVPLGRLLLETDAPWCGIKASHASARHAPPPTPAVKKEKWAPGTAVKDRCEPADIVAVATVVATLKGCSVEEVALASTANARALFRI
jgi:TatD DNase family protein